MLEIGNLVNNKYKIINWLGEGGMAKTYLAINSDDKDKQLVVKAVQLKGLKEWKILELFKREAKILKSLNHPKIPKYVDYFVEEQEDNIMYFLVYEYIEGESLSSILDKGKIFSYEAVNKMMKQILEILVYLHDIVPSVVHRDINPNNIIMKDNGDVYLVDFGAVQDTIIKNTKLGGSTFVGTYGYLPLEQLSGKATPQSDLYALGMTAIKLLTGKSPHTFEMINLKPKYKDKNDYNQLDKIINMMIELDLKERIKSAKKVLSELSKQNCYSNITNSSIDYDNITNSPTNYDNNKYIEQIKTYISSNNTPSNKICIETLYDTISIVIKNNWNGKLSEILPNFFKNYGNWFIPLFSILVGVSLAVLLLVLVPLMNPIIPLLLIPLLLIIGASLKLINPKDKFYIKIQLDKNYLYIPKGMKNNRIIHKPSNLEQIPIKNIIDIKIKKEKDLGIIKNKYILDINILLKDYSTKKIIIPNLLLEDAEYLSSFFDIFLRNN